jgi:hypothetical protein
MAAAGPSLARAAKAPQPPADSAAPAPKILVAYYSRTGTTRAVAQELASRLGADLEEIVDTRGRKGFWGWLGAGRDASKKSKTTIAPVKRDPAGYDLVVLGTPVWAWNMTPAIRTYILANRDGFKQVAFFCTMGKNGDVKTFAGMAELCGRKPLAAMALRTEEVKIRQYQSGINKFLIALKDTVDRQGGWN